MLAPTPPPAAPSAPQPIPLGEQLAGVQIVAARHQRHRRARLIAFSDNGRLVLVRSASPAPATLPRARARTHHLIVSNSKLIGHYPFIQPSSATGGLGRMLTPNRSDQEI